MHKFSAGIGIAAAMALLGLCGTVLSIEKSIGREDTAAQVMQAAAGTTAYYPI